MPRPSDMGEVHRLILQHGLDGARLRAETQSQRSAIDAAGVLMAEEASRIGVTHAGFAMTSLPHRRIETAVWRRQGHRTTLLVESGHTASGTQVGVPYGSVARLILLYLQTESIKIGSREVELGRSMYAWMGRMGLDHGGRNYKLVAEQATRISACRLTFFTDLGEGAQHRHNGAFVQDAITLSGLLNEVQPSLWQDRVRLDEGFWKSLREHPIPVREEAVRAIGGRSMAFDVYVWLAYRLHSLSKRTPVSWPALHSQFGAGFKLLRQFKPRFLETLSVALAVYPEAQVSEANEGIILYPSPPAVPRPEAHRLA
jgi:Plasmid encoded RepA protein